MRHHGCVYSSIVNSVSIFTFMTIIDETAIDVGLQEDDDHRSSRLALRSVVHRGKMAIMSVMAEGGNNAPTHFDAKKYSGCADQRALRTPARQHGLPNIHR